MKNLKPKTLVNKACNGRLEFCRGGDSNGLRTGEPVWGP